MTLNFKEEIISELNSDEVANRIKRMTKPFATENVFNLEGNKGYPFEGDVEKHQFVIYPLFNYGANQLLRPKIIGNIENHNLKSIIKLEFHLPQSIKYILLMGLLFNILGYNSIVSDINTYLVFMALTILICYYGYKYKINKSISIIKSEVEK